MAKSIMIQGTMSNVGKSLITAGLCRIFVQDGYRVAPFKSQNMALNSFITRENLEIGRAQAAQAHACKEEPSVLMNPILLKPTTDMGSQVIVNGEVVGNMRAMDYFKRKKEYIPVIRRAYQELADSHDIVVIEGAGSPAEINLKQDDIVNMGMARIADAPVLLAGDIDRGGVFAQLYGTVQLLEEEEQRRIKGLIINKFRGDKKILEPGLKMLRDLCGKEVLGVVPYADVDIEDEDSLAASLERKDVTAAVDIAVIRLPRISNFTDFGALTLEHEVSVRYVEKLSELGRPDAVILPGTKNTIRDLKWLRSSGLEGAIVRLAKQGVIVLGICGGYQMLGERIEDEAGVEGEDSIRGMGLLPTVTYFEAEKTRTRMEGRTGLLNGIFAPLSGMAVSGYEIHMGKTVVRKEEAVCLNFLFQREDGAGQSVFGKENGAGQSSYEKEDGCVKENVLGTYLHGIFDEPQFRMAFVRMLCNRKGIEYGKASEISFEAYREQQFDRLADLLREGLDMEAIYRILEEGA